MHLHQDSLSLKANLSSSLFDPAILKLSGLETMKELNCLEQSIGGQAPLRRTQSSQEKLSKDYFIHIEKLLYNALTF